MSSAFLRWTEFWGQSKRHPPTHARTHAYTHAHTAPGCDTCLRRAYSGCKIAISSSALMLGGMNGWHGAAWCGTARHGTGHRYMVVSEQQRKRGLMKGLGMWKNRLMGAAFQRCKHACNQLKRQRYILGKAMCTHTNARVHTRVIAHTHALACTHRHSGGGSTVRLQEHSTGGTR